MRNLFYNKKAEIPRTITWFVAFSIIIFILATLAVTSFSLTGQKYLSSNKNKILFEKAEELQKYQSQRFLMKILNTPVEGQENVLDFIFKLALSKDNSIKDKIEKKIIDILDEGGINYFLFIADYSYTSGDDILLGETSISEDKLFRYKLFYEGNEINLGFYFEKDAPILGGEKENPSEYMGTQIGGKWDKDKVVIHYTAGGGTYKGVESTLKNKGLSVQYILQRDGKVAECVLNGWRLVECVLKDASEVTGEWERYSAQHAGCGGGENALPECSSECISDYGLLIPKCSKGICCIKGFNQRGIGIEIINWGSACGAEKIKQYCPDGIDLIHRADRREKTWQKFTDEQIDALVILVSGIVKRNNIPVDKEHIIGHDDITNNKHDPGPAFPWEDFMLRLKENVGDIE